MNNVVSINQNQLSFKQIVADLTKLCQQDLVSVNTIILDKLDSNVPLVQEVAKYLILSGGNPSSLYKFVCSRNIGKPNVTKSPCLRVPLALLYVNGENPKYKNIFFYHFTK